VEDIVKIISSSNNNTNRFTPTGDGDLDIDKVEWTAGRLKLEMETYVPVWEEGNEYEKKQKVIKDGLYYEAEEKIETTTTETPGSSDKWKHLKTDVHSLSDYDYNLKISSLSSIQEWKDGEPFDQGQLVSHNGGHWRAKENIVGTPTETPGISTKWSNVNPLSPVYADYISNDTGKSIQVYLDNPWTTKVVDVKSAIDTLDIYGVKLSASATNDNLNSSLVLTENPNGNHYDEGATAVFEATGHFGKALDLSDPESAQRAFENMAREISDLGDQVDQLAQNMTKINLSNDHVSRQLAIRKDMGSELSDEVLQSETLKLQQFEILRDYHISLLHKVMRVNEDMVRMLVLK
jgi:hypothetical protein